MTPPKRALGILTALGALVSGVLLASLVYGADLVTPTQTQQPINRSSTSSSNTALTMNITPTAQTSVHLYGLSVFCSAGNATVSISGAASWTSSPGMATASITGVAWTPAPLTGIRGQTMTITVSTCGSGNTSTLNVQSDIF